MTIAVDTRCLGAGRNSAGSFFDAHLLTELAHAYPADRFLWCSDKPLDASVILPANVTTFIISPEIKNALHLQYWFNYKLPALLRRQKADVFLCTGGISSLRTRIPQCLVVDDTAVLHAPAFTSATNSRYRKKNMAIFLQKAASVATVSAFSRSLIAGDYKMNEEDIGLLPVEPEDVFVPVSFEEREKIKDRYSDGKEYFLAPCVNNAGNNLLNLLKAFSFFKRRQKSNMLLLITGDPGDAFINDLKTYKFRDEVRVLADPGKKEMALLTAAAYALVYPVLYADSALVPARAMQCGVPVITSNTGALPGYCADAALYVNPGSFEDIAQKIMLLFKDEEQAKELAKKGAARVRANGKSNVAAFLRAWIKQAVNG